MDRLIFERAQPDEVRVTYRWFCSMCNEMVEQICFGNYIQYPLWPGDGWHQFALGGWLCPRHQIMSTVVVTDSSKVQTLERLI